VQSVATTEGRRAHNGGKAADGPCKDAETTVEERRFSAAFKILQRNGL